MGNRALIRSFSICSSIILFTPALFAQSLSFHVQPGVSIPLPGAVFDYDIGVNANVGVDYQLPFAPFLIANGALNYTSAGQAVTGEVLSLIAAGAGIGVSATVLDKLHLRAVGSGGMYEAIYAGSFGGSGYYSVEAGATWALLPTLALGLGASYTDYLSPPNSLYRGLKAWLGLSITPAEKHTPKVVIPEPGIKLSPIFPIFYKYFDTTPLGSITVTNNEKKNVTRVRASFYIKDFMDGPKYSDEIPLMKQGESREVPLYALLKESVLSITEDTKVMAQIKVLYTYDKEDIEVGSSQSMRIYNRNAMTWEDNRRAAAFVTSKDPAVLKLAKSVNGMVRDLPSPAANLNFRIAMGMFEALGLHGIRYNLNPKGSYAELSVNKFTVDYLQFPRQTLSYKGGDCSDISILYGALLESLDIETAFITVPGHIFLAFAPGIDSKDAKAMFSSFDDLIVKDDKVWVPVEITMVTDGFLKAWQEGAREWRENVDTRDFYPMRENWKVYEPAWLPGDEGSAPDIARNDLSKRYSAALSAFIDREVGARESALKLELAKAPASSASLNKLGVLYARFGLTAKARTQFEAAVKKADYVPALINLGNILFLERNWTAALQYYERARKKEAQNATVLLSLAKTKFEMEKYDEAQALYGQVVGLKPELAKTYAFLGEKTTATTRAASAEERESVVWGEE